MNSITDAYVNRLEYLHQETGKEGISIRERSIDDFWSFVDNHPGLRVGHLFANDFSQLRLVWKHDSGNHVGILFLGDDIVGHMGYVVMQYNEEGERTGLFCGRCYAHEFDELMDTLNMWGYITV